MAAHKIKDIKGLDDETKKKMEEAGIKDVEHLMEQCSTPARKTALAKKLGIPGSQLTEFVNRADLLRLKGVGPEMANLLEEGGVDSVKELRRRTPENLANKLKALNDEKKIAHRAPTLQQIQGWIQQADEMYPKAQGQESQGNGQSS